MLSNIRHIQKGLLIAVTIVIVISFAFLYSDFDFVSASLGRSDCIVKVYDRCYRVKEYQKLASEFDVAIQLGMYDFATVLFGENRMDRDPTDFVMSLVVLRKEAEKLGIEPSDAEITAAMPELPIFQQPWVNVDYIKNNILGPNGFTEGDLAQLVKDYLSFQKLRDLVTMGVEVIPSETTKRYIQANQRYTASVIHFDRDPKAADIQPSEEDIKKYYDENQDTLKTEPKRGFQYVKFTPKKVAEDASNEDRAKANLEFANAVNYAYADLAAEGADFAAVAKERAADQSKYAIESGSFEAFPQNEAPEALKDNDMILRALFAPTTQLGDVTVPFEAGEGAYYVFKYENEVEPEPLSLEDGESAIRETLISRRSNQAASDAASDALAKLNEAIAGGKSFAEAAKSLNLKVEALPNFSENEPLTDNEDAILIVEAVSGLGEKEISAVTKRVGGAGYLLVYVDKIEIYKDSDAIAKKQALERATKSQLDRTLFLSWFNQRLASSGAQRPNMSIQLQ